MIEIKTEVGYARAFIRLALERKLLWKHLKELLSNEELLRLKIILSVSFPEHVIIAKSLLIGRCINAMRSCVARKRGNSSSTTFYPSTLSITSALQTRSREQVRYSGKRSDECRVPYVADNFTVLRHN